MPINGKDTAAAMRAAGWTETDFMLGLNETIRAELARSKGKTNQPEPEPITMEQATEFLAKGTGIYGDAADTLERFCDRRTGMSNSSGMCFMKPPERQTLKMVMPPVIVSKDAALSMDGADIRFADITNQKARKKMLADGISHSA